MGKFSGDTFLFKVLLAGESTVGKSCLMEKYMTNYFPYEPKSTIGVDYEFKELEHMGLPIKLQLWDTAGQERYQSITTSYYRGSDCVILCYDTTNRSTFFKLDSWIEQIKEHGNDNIKIFLVGTKTDKKKRMVAKGEALSFANINNLQHCDVSSRVDSLDDLSDKLFIPIIEMLYQRDKNVINKGVELMGLTLKPDTPKTSNPLTRKFKCCNIS
jgi:Ras-related protein Rab-2A